MFCELSLYKVIDHIILCSVCCVSQGRGFFFTMSHLGLVLIFTHCERVFFTKQKQGHFVPVLLQYGTLQMYMSISANTSTHACSNIFLTAPCIINFFLPSLTHTLSYLYLILKIN